MAIKPKLQLNYHPSKCENLSLVDAIGVQISNDLAVLENEKSLEKNIFYNKIFEYYNTKFNIISIIPCNTELIVFVQNPITNNENCDIFRCNEEINDIKKVSLNYKYFGGKIIGTFTYNSRNQLILSISEYNSEKLIPLKSFNIGSWEECDILKENSNIQIGDLWKDYEVLSNKPIIQIPNITNIKFINGKTYKGWYSLFIRFKINLNDYTQWYNIGQQIYIGDLSEQSPIKVYGYNNKKEKFVTGYTDWFNDAKSISNETISFKILNLNSDINKEYENYQLAYICSANDNIIAKRTYDISIDTNEIIIKNELFTIIESIENLTIDFYNYYDVHNIINFKNRTYIANYKEKNNIENINDIVKNININFEYINNDNSRDVFYYKDARYNIFNKYNQFIVDNPVSVALNNIYGINENKTIKVKDFVDSDWMFKSDVLYDVSGSNFTHSYIQDVHNRFDHLNLVKYVSELIAKDELEISSNNGGLIRDNKVYCNYYETLRIQRINSSTGYTYNIIYTATYDINNSVSGIKNGLDLNGLSSFSLSLSNNIIDTTKTFIHSDIAKNFKINITNSKLINNNLNIIFGDKVEVIIDGINRGSINTSNLSVNPIIHTSNSYNKRKLNTTLIPGEIYNFYIHFINKYGEVSQGYKLNNNKGLKYIIDNKKIYCNIVPFNNNYSLCVPVNQQIFNGDEININNIYAVDLNFWDGKYNEYDTIQSNELFSLSNVNITKRDIKNKYIEFIDTDIIWGDLDDCFNSYEWKSSNFNPVRGYLYTLAYINSNNDILFKVPSLRIFDDDTDICFPYIKLKVSNVTLPDDYIGWFISYEEFERANKITGILTNSDFNNDPDIYTEETNKDGFYDNNKINMNNIFLYSSKFDIDTNFDSNGILHITHKVDFPTKYTQITINEVSNIINYFNLNCPTYNLELYNEYFKINNPDILAGGDGIKNRNGLGTVLKIKNTTNIFDLSKYNFYIATIFNSKKNIYTSKNKTLIRLSDYYYNNEDTIINNGYNGYHDYDGIFCYNSNKIYFNSATTKIVNDIYKNYDDKYPIGKYFQFPLIDTMLNETKEFNNKPQFISTLLQPVEDLDKKDQLGEFAISNVVTPENSIDLFKNKYIKHNNFNYKVYNNFNKELQNVTNYSKTIRRSNIIQDESLINSWREFPLEGYKIINENKGNITNLVNLNDILLVHTEHSLFAFYIDDTLKTNDKNIRLEALDVFDVDYKEIFTSKLGHAGLQDYDAYIVDIFGYIFYDNSSNRIFNFDGKQLNYIDTDIINYFDYFKPNKLRFGYDKINNRILICYSNNNMSNTFSYNILSNSFISRHNYNFNNAYNTKNKLYLIDSDNQYNNIISFSELEKYGNIYNENKENGSTITLKFIINDTYDIIKYLEFIIYKVYINIMTETDDFNETYKRRQPYSGTTIRVYNDLVDTGKIDIKITEEIDKNTNNYKKPYWELGNWNFNYLRDILHGNNTTEMSRIYGNYFIVEFTFNKVNENYKIEFEDLKYKLSEK